MHGPPISPQGGSATRSRQTGLLDRGEQQAASSIVGEGALACPVLNLGPRHEARVWNERRLRTWLIQPLSGKPHQRDPYRRNENTPLDALRARSHT